MPFPPSGNLPDPGMEPASPVPCALTGRFYSTEPPGKTYLSIPSLPLTILMRFTQPYSVINPSWYIYHDGCCSVFLNCRPTLCNPMDCSKPGFSVHHHLLEPGDAIQPSDPVIPFSCLQSLPASCFFPVSWHYASGGQHTIASASVLPMNIHDWFPLGLTGLIFSGPKHQFFGTQPSLWSNSHIHTWPQEKPYLSPEGLVGKIMPLF